MLKDITIGQYFPGNSLIHRLDPRFKIVITFIYILMLFTGSNHCMPCWSRSRLYRDAIYSLAYTGEDVLEKRKAASAVSYTYGAAESLPRRQRRYAVHWKFIKITEGGINISVFMIIRIVLLIMGSSLLTYTTSPITLTDAIERLLSPLKKLKFPVHELAMMMSIALRFIPTLIEETDKIMSAQKARGAEIDTGSFMTRAKNMISILVPLFISSFRRADELATAMECRCYNGGEGRTRLRQLQVCSA